MDLPKKGHSSWSACEEINDNTKWDGDKSRTRHTLYNNCGRPNLPGRKPLKTKNINPVNIREEHRNILREIYEEEEEEKRKEKRRCSCKKDIKKCIEKQKEAGNTFSQIVLYLSTEHEILFQIIIALPLILMAVYIVAVEQGPLVRYHGKNV